jgi:hypothetical protein
MRGPPGTAKLRKERSPAFRAGGGCAQQGANGFRKRNSAVVADGGADIETAQNGSWASFVHVRRRVWVLRPGKSRLRGDPLRHGRYRTRPRARGIPMHTDASRGRRDVDQVQESAPDEVNASRQIGGRRRTAFPNGLTIRATPGRIDPHSAASCLPSRSSATSASLGVPVAETSRAAGRMRHEHWSRRASSPNSAARAAALRTRDEQQTSSRCCRGLTSFGAGADAKRASGSSSSWRPTDEPGAAKRPLLTAPSALPLVPPATRRDIPLIRRCVARTP